MTRPFVTPFWLVFFLFYIGLIHSAQAQVVANFSASSTSGCAPLLIQYTDLSSSPSGILSRSWDFGDGTSTSVANPAKLYAAAGTFTICLTVVDSTGATDTDCKTSYINIAKSPTANFSTAISAGCVPVSTQFNDASVQGSSAIVSRTWSFGDGNGSTALNPFHTYTATGLYDVTLSITDQNGCSNQITKSAVEVNEYPIADFIPDATNFCTAPATVHFTNLTTAPLNANMVYKWSFGDGGASSFETPLHTYTAQGLYSVQLIATNMVSGCSDTAAMANLIEISSTAKASFVNAPQQACGTTPIAFVNTTACPSTNWFWDFGDGTTSTLENPQHAYASPGCYNITFTATVNGVQVTTTSSSCIQINPLPTVAYAALDSLISCSLPHTVGFLANVNLPNVSWLWDFGDGTTSTLQTPTHQYLTEGDFPISVSATTPQGCTTTIRQDTMFSRPVRAAFFADLNALCRGASVVFADSSKSYYPIASWNWNFGDTTSTDRNPVITFQDTGVTQISLIVANNQNCADTFNIPNVRVGDSLEVTFFSLDTIACVDSDVAFVNTTDLATQKLLKNWVWSFGDGATSLDLEPTHTYQDTGTYTIRVTADYYNCRSELKLEDYIFVAPPKAEFTTSRDCAAPLSVTFINKTVGGHRYYWDFGVPNTNADTSTLENPVFTYPTHGTYSIKLVAYNDSTGCEHDHITTLNLTPAEDVNIALSTRSGCVPLSVFTTNSSSLATYSWYAPGATISNSKAAQPVITYNTFGIYDTISVTVAHPNGCIETIVLADSTKPFITVSDILPFASLNTVSGCTPLTVSFTDLSTPIVGKISSWLWLFGDGDSSNLQNPQHIYTQIGTYNVQLIVSDTSGCVRNAQLASPIAPTAPSMTINAFEKVGCTGEQLQYAGTATGIGIQYQWNFGDGTTSTLKSTQHTYQNEGIYPACLKITDINGCINTTCDTVVIADPVANFTANNTTSICQSLSTQFTDLSANAIAWQWDFGDGTGAFVRNPTKVYNNGGTYDVTLIVTGVSGCKDTLRKNDFITVTGPAAYFTYNDSAGCPGKQISFTAYTNKVSKYTWVFGDFTTQITFAQNQISDTATVTHTYNDGGLFIPSLIVEDNNGCVRTFIATDTIRIEDFSVAINKSVPYLCGTGDIKLTHTIKTNKPIVSKVWTYNNFPTGGTSSANTLNLNYNNTGTYPISLTVSNTGCTRTAHDTIVVAEIPNAHFGVAPNLICAPQSALFIDSSSISNGVITSWNWNFGTGNNTDTVANTSFLYQNAGNYNVYLIVTSDKGCSDTSKQIVNVFDKPITNAGSNVTICEGSSTILQASGGVSYQWSTHPSLSCFNCENPKATPTQTTVYTLTATNTVGCTSTDQITVIVSPRPKAVISNGNIQSCDGAFISFINGSTTTGGYINKWEWDFGDSVKSNLQNPSHAYITPNIYTAKLIVTNNFSCKDTTSRQVTINPMPNVIASEDVYICKGGKATLSVSGANSYVWLPTNTLNCITCQTVIANPTVTTTYFVKGTTNSCSKTDTVQVEVSPYLQPIISVSNDTTICQGDVIQLFVAGGNSVLNYIWDTDRDSLSCYEYCNNPFASPNITTTYPVTLFGEGGCNARDSIIVTVVEPLQNIIDLSQVTICKGDSITLKANIGTQHEWTPYEGLSCVFCPEVIVFPTSTQKYAVKALDEIGCVITDTVQVNVLQTDSISAGLDTVICKGEAVQLQAVGIGTLQWQPHTTINNPSSLNPTVAPTTTTNYILTADIGACVVTDTVTVFVVSKVNIEGIDATICEGDSTVLKIKGIGTNFKWSPDFSLSNANIRNPIAFPSQSTTYTVIADIPKCISDTAIVNIKVAPIPTIDGYPVQYVFKGQTTPLKLQPTINASYIYQWTPVTYLTCADCPTPILVATEELKYFLTVASDEGCIAEDSIQITFAYNCDESLLIVPNAFSPNGDGLNDKFYVRSSLTSEILSFRIFSRSGKLIFETDNMSDGWDGSVKGQAGNTGVYIYIVEAICPVSGNIVQKRGNVTLMR